jgi:hypothetical protein
LAGLSIYLFHKLAVFRDSAYSKITLLLLSLLKTVVFFVSKVIVPSACFKYIASEKAKHQNQTKGQGSSNFLFYLSLVLLCLLLKLCQGSLFSKFSTTLGAYFLPPFISESGDKDMKIIFSHQTFQCLILKTSSFNQSAEMGRIPDAPLYQ